MNQTRIAHDPLTLQLLCAQQPHGYVRVHDRYNWAHARCVVEAEIRFLDESFEAGIEVSCLEPVGMRNDKCVVCIKP